MTEDLRKKYLAIQDFIPEAKAYMSPEGWDYMIGGTETGMILACDHAVGLFEVR